LERRRRVGRAACSDTRDAYCTSAVRARGRAARADGHAASRRTAPCEAGGRLPPSAHACAPYVRGSLPFPRPTRPPSLYTRRGVCARWRSYCGARRALCTNCDSRRCERSRRGGASCWPARTREPRTHEPRTSGPRSREQHCINLSTPTPSAARQPHHAEAASAQREAAASTAREPALPFSGGSGQSTTRTQAARSRSRTSPRSSGAAVEGSKPSL
jgi:hypothetical protein